jgi:hypothetical protein
VVQKVNGIFHNTVTHIAIVPEMKQKLVSAVNPFACYFFKHMAHLDKLIFGRTRWYKSIYNLKIDAIEMLMHHSINALFFSFKTMYDMSEPSTGRKIELKERH